MKKRMVVAWAVLLGFMFMFSGIAQAQRTRMTPEDQAKALKDSLGLTADQTTQITIILTDAREETTALMSKNNDDRDAMRTSMQAIQKKTDKQIKAVLTDEQAKKYDALMVARHARIQQMRERRGQPQ